MNERRIKTQIMLYFKFFGALLHNITFIESKEVPTAGIDKVGNLYYNNEFMDTLTEKEQLFVICHEILHAAFGQVFRIFALPKEYHLVGNMAGDYLVNEVLHSFGMQMPKGCLYKKEWTVDKYTMEDIIRELLKNSTKIDIPVLGFDMKEGGTKGEKKEDQTQEEKKFEQKIKQALVAATEIAKKQGKLPASIERLMGEMLKPKVNWRSELQDWFNVKIKTERSWHRPNRRFIREGMYLPTKDNLGCGHIGIGVDVSGSIGQKELDTFGSELNYIFSTCSPRKISIVYFESKVVKEETYDELPIKLTACGGGGTIFKSCFDKFNQLEDPIQGMVFMSDGYGDWVEEPPYPVIMLSTTKEVMPFGKTLHVEMLEE